MLLSGAIIDVWFETVPGNDGFQLFESNSFFGLEAPEGWGIKYLSY